MSKIFFIFLINLTLLNAWTWEKAAYIAKHLHDSNFNLSSKTKETSTSYTNLITTFQSDRSFARPYINAQKCDRILANDIITTCYNDSLKSAVKVAYVLDGLNVNSVNLKKRAKWHYNNKIPKKYRSNNYDYSKTGYDKGHLAMDSGFDFNKKILFQTYDLNINSVPMAAKVNRKTWIKAERYSKQVAKKLGYVKVIDFMIYDKFPKRIGKHKIAVPKGFYKILFNDTKHFKKCFYYENIKNPNLKNDTLKQHVVECKQVFKLLRR